ncbi:hypothetical protein [Sutcliffiella horikoshii]|uniref:hypothetical protein n=1 Tax=Sutcliffiella horikoshii TaxID=79883 RepID=UPI00385118E1
MDKRLRLIQQIKVVLSHLEREFGTKLTSGVLELIYKRYQNGLVILQQNDDVAKIHIVGGVRAYLDSCSDYDNSLLEEMHKAEKLYKKL